MRRRLFNLLSVIWLLACLATVAAWLWSYRVANGPSILISRVHVDTYHHWNITLLLIDGKALLLYDTQQFTIPAKFLPLWSAQPPRHFEWAYARVADSQTRRMLLDHYTDQHPTYFDKRDAIYHPEVRWTHLGVYGYSTRDIGMNIASRALLFPFWPVVIGALLLASLPTRRFIRAWIRRRRRIAGICVVCGYDLRATPDRCPECGTVAGNHAISAPSASPAP